MCACNMKKRKLLHKIEKMMGKICTCNKKND